MIDATPILRMLSRRRLSVLERQDAAAIQWRQLERMLRRAADTRFGRDHGFAAIRDLDGFRRRVPLRRYEDFWSAYWQPEFPRLDNVTWPGTVRYFAKTSGTSSGDSKYVPVTSEIMAGYRRAVLDMLAFHLRDRPRSRVLGGQSFMLGGSTDLEELAPGIRAGDISGIAAQQAPLWARAFMFPPPALARIADWERKMAILGPLSLQHDIRILGGTASWLLLFLQDVMALRPADLPGCYPALELIVYGGVNFAPYRAQFEALVAGTDIDLREVYPASEGFLAVADRGVGEGLRLQVDGGLFLEFVPVEDLDSVAPHRAGLGSVETGVNYAVVVSTPAGLWGYVVGDTVRFVELDPPRILVTGRVSSSLSAFGEHLIEEEIDRAVTVAAASIGADVVDFTVGPVFPTGEERRGRHLFVVEFAVGRTGEIGEERAAAFGRSLDAALCELNADYAAHRAGDLQMGPPEILVAPPGAFAGWMKVRGRLGAQNKVPRVLADADAMAALRALTERGGVRPAGSRTE
ncbi:MAG: GH3 auxin-responsive promoter family protein [Alphaproteobacteria bacterium]